MLCSTNRRFKMFHVVLNVLGLLFAAACESVRGK
jgi:hypothetical protein